MKRILKRSKLLLGLLAGIVLLISSCKKDDIIVSAITLDKTTASVQVGSTVSLTSFLTPANATNKNVIWRSGSQRVATVVNGVVTGAGLGNTTIFAISQSDTTIQTTCSVTTIPASGMTTVPISGDITASTTWTSNKIYLLSGFVYVRSPAVLTIEPGTLIKGVSNTKAALMIERGAKIMAQGTVSQPIVFTSDKAKGLRSYGDWGGLVLCGKAPSNKHDSGTGVGIAEGGIGSLYGGTDPADNSGTLQYIRIEFPGIGLTATPNSEINGLTLYAVGSGTTIDHVQVSYSGDDSYEWFGGTVNCKYLVALRGWDDEWDTDNGYSGKVQFFVSLRDPSIADQSTSNGFESDNDADGSTLSPYTSAIFVNGSVFGPKVTTSTTINSLFGHGTQIRRGSRLSLYNTVIAGWPYGIYIDGALGDSPAQATANTLQIENCVISGMGTNYKENATSLQNTAAWFTSASKNNTVLATNDLLLVTNPFNLTAPNFLPSTGSPLLTGASFTNSRLTDTFFTPVTFKGAFGTTDWTSGWCNFDPQNTDY
jgi:hypothetical protein